MFVEGIKNGFHKFEHIDQANSISWEYKPSILNGLDTSESNILSLCFNQRIMHEFLYDDITANPKIYNAHRTKITIKHRINNYDIELTKQQIEIDMTCEKESEVTIFEAKNGTPSDFAIYQIYLPALYYHTMKQNNSLGINKINCCYLLHDQKGDAISVYRYEFTDLNNMASIRLCKSKRYILKRK